MTRSLPDHGTISRRKHHGCKCVDCCEALRAYNRKRYAAQVAGTWQPFLDAEPVRQHLLTLAAVGITSHRVTELADLPRRTVDGFLRRQGMKGRKRGTTAEIAAKILAIQPDPNLAAKIDATGTHRRLQALSAQGWPMETLGIRIGVQPRYMPDLLTQRRVLRATAEAAREVYEQLRTTRPERAGVSKKSATRARARASTLRWPPTSYWDKFPGAIDDPHFTPEYGKTRPELRAEEAVWMVTVAGVPRTEAAARLGLTFGEVDEALARDDMRRAA
ncbi:hypothetical protein ACIBEA_30070 [Streptomyces sp. NPDC051555]|uniref:hypothetical protein n=1 Tax=Streptomyces sp. NPDC051555 TaxID=3365657 RepID=UPI003792CEC1